MRYIMTYVRINIYLTKTQQLMLKGLAAKKGTKFSELVRAVLQGYIDAN